MTAGRITSAGALDALPVGEVINSRVVAARKVERPARSGSARWACTDGTVRTSADMVTFFAPLWSMERPSAAAPSGEDPELLAALLGAVETAVSETTDAQGERVRVETGYGEEPSSVVTVDSAVIGKAVATAVEAEARAVLASRHLATRPARRDTDDDGRSFEFDGHTVTNLRQGVEAVISHHVCPVVGAIRLADADGDDADLGTLDDAFRAAAAAIVAAIAGADYADAPVQIDAMAKRYNVREALALVIHAAQMPEHLRRLDAGPSTRTAYSQADAVLDWLADRPTALEPRALAGVIAASVRAHGVLSIKAALAIFGLRIEVAPDGR